MLSFFDTSAKGSAALSTALQNLVQGIDVAALYSQFEANFNAVILNQDYSGLLAIYNRKSMATQICSALGLRAGELTELVIRLARTEDAATEVRAAVRPYLGNFAAVGA